MNDENENLKQAEELQEKQARRKTLLLCDIALIMEGASGITIASFSIWGILAFMPVVQILAILLAIAAVCAPLVGVVLGISSLFIHTRNKHNIACSVIAIAAPIIAIITVIILFSTHVLVISFM